MRLLLTILALATSTISSTLAEPPPPPPATVAELKKNPGGLEQLSGDLREHYGNFPVTAVYKRETERVNISYLVNGETIFGYRFEFIQPGDATQLWQDSIDQFITTTFPQATYRHEPGSTTGTNGSFYRTDHVLNVAAYEEAKKAYAAAETIRLQQQSFGNTSPAVEKTAAENVQSLRTKLPPPGTHTPQTIAGYQQRFPDTLPIEATRGSVPGFEYASTGDLPIDSYYIRKPGDMALLILVHRGTIIGYVAKLHASGSSNGMWERAADAGLKASFPDPAYSRSMVGNSQTYYFYRIIDKAANKAAIDGYLAEESAKMKALLNP